MDNGMGQNPGEQELFLSHRSEWFQGKRPISIRYADGREVTVPTWKSVMTEILQECNHDQKLHERLISICENVWGKNRAILAKSPKEMRLPFRIDDEIYVETHYDTARMLNILKSKILDAVEYDYSKIRVKVWDPLQHNAAQNLKDKSSGLAEPLPGRIEDATRMPLSYRSEWFKGKRPISIRFADGREVAVPTWRSMIAEILKDCNRDEIMHQRLKDLCDNAWGKNRAILASSPLQMNHPRQIDDNLYVETYYDTQEMLTVLKNRILDVIGYDYGDISIKLRESFQKMTRKELDLDSGLMKSEVVNSPIEEVQSEAETNLLEEIKEITEDDVFETQPIFNQ